jgi:MraZ protein
VIRVRCQQHVSVDVKGRLALPAPIRRALEEAGEEELVLAYSHQGSVLGFTKDDWEARVEGSVSIQDAFSDDVNDWAHATLSTATDVEVDGQGRVRVPQHLRELAGLQKDCVVHVVLGRLEIWDRAAWERRFEQAVARTKERGGLPRRGA